MARTPITAAGSGAPHGHRPPPLVAEPGQPAGTAPVDRRPAGSAPVNGGMPTPVNQASDRPVDWAVGNVPRTVPSGAGSPASAGPRPARHATGEALGRPELVALPLPDGVALATLADFAAGRTMAARLLSGHPALTTIAVSVRDGGFLLGDHRGGESIHSGHLLARVLGNLPSWGGDVRTWLTWPTDPELQRRLDANLAEFADTMGATVWAPPPGGSAEVIDACGDLGALDRDGQPARWRRHAPAGESIDPQFESDADGRLVPVGGVLVGSYPGVRLVSVPPQRSAAMADRYAHLTRVPGIFAVDLAVRSDGRLAGLRADGTLLALGRNECRTLLAAAGWRDEDLLLLCPGDGAALPRYAGELFAGLGVHVWLLPPGATVQVHAGQPRAVGPDGRPVTWQRITPPGTAAFPARWRSEDGRLVRDDPTTPGSWFTSNRSDRPQGAPPVPPDDRPVNAPPPIPLPALPRPTLGVLRRDRKLGIPWLPERPRVNVNPFDLYIRTEVPPQQATVDGLPSPELYLLGELTPPPLPTNGPPGYLVQVRVAPGGAVDMTAEDFNVPPTVYLSLAGREVFLLPAGRLDRLRVTAAYILAPTGEPTGVEVPDGGPVRLRCVGAWHGVDGLPNDVPRWPIKAPALTYALVAASGPPASGIPLYRRRPPAQPGQRLLELRVERRQAIDLRAAAAEMAPLKLVRPTAEPRTARSGLILPARCYDQVTVTRVLGPKRRRWQPLAGYPEQSLSEMAVPSA